MKVQVDPKRLTLRRVEAGLNMTALAEQVGVSKGHVSMVERGLANFSPRNLVKIATVLQCSIDDLIVPVKPDTTPESES
ncbi:helix-turn-helix domain-containing protein [Streptomyces hydrogenans]|uniref:helix-turn-helix domain-containing protein n=1 Tax=Streptomyces hydrogenans TaxID=1873719 RepID=UPI003696AB63